MYVFAQKYILIQPDLTQSCFQRDEGTDIVKQTDIYTHHVTAALESPSAFARQKTDSERPEPQRLEAIYLRAISIKTSQSNTKKATRNILVFSSSYKKNFMNYCLLYKKRFIMERLFLVTVLIVASTIASPVVDVSNILIPLQSNDVSSRSNFKGETFQAY